MLGPDLFALLVRSRLLDTLAVLFPLLLGHELPAIDRLALAVAMDLAACLVLLALLLSLCVVSGLPLALLLLRLVPALLLAPPPPPPPGPPPGPAIVVAARASGRVVINNLLAIFMCRVLSACSPVK